MNSSQPLLALPPKVDIDRLLVSSEELQARIQNLADELSTLSSRSKLLRVLTHLASMQATYVAAASRLRSVVARTIGLRAGAAMLIGTITGSLIVIATRSPIATMIAAVIGFAFSVAMLFWPNDDDLSKFRTAISGRRAELARQSEQYEDRRAAIKAQLGQTRLALHERELEISDARERNSIQLRRERLVRMNWKAMRGPELEEFLALAFKELGYDVEMIGTSGDQGTDLIVTKDCYRFAIQSKGYFDSVSNGAVQEAFAGMTYHGCHACVVITNSRFTASAVELARRTRCTLIDENSLPALIRGELDLIEKHFPTARQVVSRPAVNTHSSSD